MTITICAMGELLAEFCPATHIKIHSAWGVYRAISQRCASNFAAQVAKLSHRAIFFGCVGNDDFARLIIERLRHEGVITDGIHVMNNAVTGTAFVSYQNPQLRDFVFNIPNSACGLFTAEHIDKDLLKQCNHLHIVGSSLFSFRMIDVMRKAITTIKSAGGTVSFDPNIRKEMLSIPEMAQALDYLIEYTDILSPAKANSFLRASQNLSEEQIVSDLLHGGVKHVAIKRAQRGASYYKLKTVHYTPSMLQVTISKLSIQRVQATALAQRLSLFSYPVSRHTRRCNMQMPAARSP